MGAKVGVIPTLDQNCTICRAPRKVESTVAGSLPHRASKFTILMQHSSQSSRGGVRNWVAPLEIPEKAQITSEWCEKMITIPCLKEALLIGHGLPLEACLISRNKSWKPIQGVRCVTFPTPNTKAGHPTSLGVSKVGAEYTVHQASGVGRPKEGTQRAVFRPDLEAS
jgi:hypothetical protein